MLLRRYTLNVFSPPCDPGAETWNAIATLEDDIGEVLPYLNATLKGAIYLHSAQALTWRMGGHSITFRPREIAISKLPDRESAAAEMQRVVDLVNRTWERRGEITPSFQTRQRLKPMEIFKLLPGTNCKACGQPTCFTFALKVTAGETGLEQCPPLLTDAFRENHEKLQRLLASAAD